MTSLHLTGLKGHHPLGFLAACGLLRCCSAWRDFGAVTLEWMVRNAGDPWTAVITASRNIDVSQIAQMLVCHSKQQRESPALTWSKKIDDRSKFREAATQTLSRSRNAQTDDVLAFLAAMASDVVTTDKGALRPTMLDLTSGNQRLLSSIRSLAGEPSRINGNPNTIPEEQLREALLGPWQYQDEEHALGWDPHTQRLHALRHKVPEQDKAKRSVRAAVFLATQALPLFPCFAVSSQLRTTAFHQDDGDDWFSWPIWARPVSLDTLRSLLAHPFNSDLKRRGVKVVYRCRRTRTGGSEGNYQIFSHSEQRPWPRRKEMQRM